MAKKRICPSGIAWAKRTFDTKTAKVTKKYTRR